MYKYAYENPDIESNGGLMCYASPSGDTGFAAGVNGMKNVSQEFMTWFKFGFFLNVGNLCVGILQILHFITEM